MIDTSSLYNPRTNRYRGVYDNHGTYRAAVTRPGGSYLHIGNAQTPEAAAQLVAQYYLETLGPEWVEMLKLRRRNAWRVRKFISSVWYAEIRPGYGQEYRRITPTDLGLDSATDPNWNCQGQGWVSEAAAMVAVRAYRDLHNITSITQPSPAA